MLSGASLDVTLFSSPTAWDLPAAPTGHAEGTRRGDVLSRRVVAARALSSLSCPSPWSLAWLREVPLLTSPMETRRWSSVFPVCPEAAGECRRDPLLP